MKHYTDFQEQIALTYAHAMFTDFLAHASKNEKMYDNTKLVFADYLEVGFEIALNTPDE